MESETTQKNQRLSGVKVPLHKLVKCLDLPSDAKKQLKRIRKDQKVVEEALPDHEQAKIRRVIGYEGAVKQVSKWEPVIKEKRKTAVIYPENSTGPSIKLNPPLPKIIKPETPLEQEVAELLKANQEFLPEKRPLSIAEERALKAKSLEEAQIRRAELLKHKAQLSYYNAKMKRQHKIKSKSYRKILRKTKEGNKAKLMEQMKYKDPEAYREWLKREEQKRVEERMTLKHRGASRAMAKKTKYAKYDDKSRAAVQEMIEKNKQLTRKVSFFEELDEVDEDDDIVLSSKEVTSRKRTLEDMEDSDGDEDDDSEDDVEEEVEKEKEEKVVTKKENPHNAKKKRKLQKEPEIKVDPLAFMKVEKDLFCGNAGLNLMVEDEGGIDVKATQKRMTIAEAFADDNVIQEFQQEKKETVEKDKPKDIDLTLPGWGEWTGIGVPVSKKKKRRFIIKAPAIPRKDQQLSHVIISETKDVSVTKHQVSSLPHPFRNVPEFERKIKKAIGKNWNPESTYRRLIKPNIVTRLGAVIKPISADAAQ